MSADLRNVPLKSVRENPVALREVDKEAEGYVSLRDSVARFGIMSPISVREQVDPETNEKYLELIDGLHRFSAACDNGLEEIPVVVESADKIETLERQIVANIARVDTKPVQYSKALLRLLSFHRTMTKAELAQRLSQSPSWVDARLSLQKLDGEIGKLVDAGDINVSNAISLAKLPKEEQVNFVEDAMTKDTAEFTQIVNDRAKAIREANRQGKDPNAVQEFTPVAHLRKPTEIKAERESKSVGAALVAEMGAKTPVDGFYVGIDWVLSLDPASLTAAKAKFEARLAKQADDRKKAEVARAEKRAAEAAKKAEEVKAKAAAEAAA